jgi:DNA-binding CsgD family transcriptional regulator
MGASTNPLTQREHMVLQQIAAGKSTKEIAHTLGIAFKTAACHRYRVGMKLGAANAADLVSRAARMRLIDILPRQANDDALWARAEAALENSRRTRQQLAEELSLQHRLARKNVLARADLCIALNQTKTNLLKLMAALGIKPSVEARFMADRGVTGSSVGMPAAAPRNFSGSSTAAQ